MKNLFSNFNRLLILTCTFLTMSVNVWGDQTYVSTFNSKAWAVTTGSTAAWTSDKDAYQYSSPNVQVTSAYSGAGATTNNSYTNIKTIKIKALTTSKGVGNITVKVGTGSAQTICSLSKNTTATDYVLNFSTPVTGKVSFVVNCSTNSMYVQSATIITEDASPRTIYLDLSGFTDWETSSAKFFAHSWGATDHDAQFTLVSCESHIYKVDNVPSGNTDLIVVRQGGSTIWQDEWNRITTTLSADKDKLVVNGWTSGSWSTYTPPTFSVTYVANGGAGSDIVVSSLACGSSHTTKPANTFTRTNWSFWKWSDQDGNKYSAGDNITINKNITLYAHWEAWSIYGELETASSWQDYYLENGSKSVSMAANITRQFLVKYQKTDNDAVYYGQTGDGAMTKDNNSWTLNGSNNVKVTTTSAGSYTFTFNTTSHNLTITYPVVNHTVTAGTITGGTATIPSSVEHGGDVTITNLTPDATHKTSYTITVTSGTYGSIDGATIKNVTSNITVNVTFTAKVQYTVTLLNNNNPVNKEGFDAQGQKTYYEGQTLGTLPTLTSADACDNTSKTFMGWAAEKISTKRGNAPSYVDSSTEVTQTITYRAVWAKEQ